MPHIHKGPGEYDTTASAYIVRLDTPEPTLMLHRHRLLGAWLQFGGHTEVENNPWQAVVLEIEQESGYNIDQLKVLQPRHRIKAMSGVVLHPIAMAPLSHKFPGLDHYHTDLGYCFTADQEPEKQPRAGESKVIECFTLEQLKKIPEDDIPINVVQIGEFLLTDGIRYLEQVPADEWSTETPQAHFE